MNVPGFNFKLERVRAVRERAEQLAQQDLAEAISRRSDTETDLRAAEALLEQAHEQQRGGAELAVSGDPSELLAHQAYVERIEAQRTNHAHDLETRESEVATRDAQLTKAASEREMLERLRERRRSEHYREVARREQSDLDEVAATNFERSRA
ncbi:MAG: flagellar export protein FliJ [Solirubrobacteraceae bacterium]